MLMRYLHRLNSNLRNGFFRVNPMNGTITFCVESLLSINQFWKLVMVPDKCIELIKFKMSMSVCLLKLHISKILYLINEIS
jgi:hypothetical protein